MQNEFRTADLGLACFLAVKGNRLRAVERDPESTYDKPRGIFVFIDDGECEKLYDLYNDRRNEEARMVDAREHFEKIRELKNVLYYNLGFKK